MIMKERKQKMKNNLKKLFALLLSLAMVLSLSAAFAEGTWTLTCPNGAPALSVSTIAATRPDDFTFITADTIPAAFASADADFIIAPINVGAKLFKGGKSSYRLAAVITWGNLVFASQRENFSLEDLKEHKLTLFGEGTINASVALFALKQFGIEPELADSLASAAETKALLETDPEAIVLTAEPMFTAAKVGNDKISGIHINELLDNGYTQAGLFVRPETLEQNQELVTAALSEIEESCGLCTSDPDKVTEAMATLEMKFPKAAIPGCSISYVPASQAKRLVEATVEIDPAQFGGGDPADEFYYGLEE
jgi:hypothetical protein